MRYLKHRSHCGRFSRKQPLIMKVAELPLPMERAEKFEASFQSALTITRGYTLSRDVQGCVESALRREKRI